MATFYTQYKRHPNGEYTVGVCTNTLCAIMGGDEIWEAVSEHLGLGHDETTEDGKITLERVECNAACDYAPVVMTNWEFFDNQTPESTIRLVEDLRSGAVVRPTRGPNRVCTFKEVSRVLAGFPDGRADEGVGAGPASLVGLALAKEQGWTAPRASRPDTRVRPPRTGSHRPVGETGATDASPAGAAGGTTMGRTEVTPASDDAKARKAEPAAVRDEADETPAEEETSTRTTGSTPKTTKKKDS